VAYAWIINLQAGDKITVTLDGPNSLHAENTATLDRAKAQYMLFAGKKSPAGGWLKGHYAGHVTVLRSGVEALQKIWKAWTTPADIMQWNAASDDWHTTQSNVDLREGGIFSSRMEAKDGSFGFDFAGTYTKIEKYKLLDCAFGDRSMQVEFLQAPDGVTIRETFDAESENPIEMQKQGWQAILNNFKKHVENT
jgi:uncharacterized protein YndB with AHSA1/START domain